MTATEIVCVVHDWYSIAPNYRTRNRLVQMLIEANERSEAARAVSESAIQEAE